MPKGSQNPSSKGGGGEDSRNYANLERKPRISLSTSTKICPWTAWTVKTWSNVRRMSKSSEVVNGGTLASIAATPDASASLIEEGWGGTAPEDSLLGREEPTLKWAALCLRKVAPMGATSWTGLRKGNQLDQETTNPMNENRMNKHMPYGRTLMNFVQRMKKQMWKVDRRTRHKSIQKHTSL